MILLIFIAIMLVIVGAVWYSTRVEPTKDRPTPISVTAKEMMKSGPPKTRRAYKSGNEYRDYSTNAPIDNSHLWMYYLLASESGTSHEGNSHHHHNDDTPTPTHNHDFSSPPSHHDSGSNYDSSSSSYDSGSSSYDSGSSDSGSSSSSFGD